MHARQLLFAQLMKHLPEKTFAQRETQLVGAEGGGGEPIAMNPREWSRPLPAQQRIRAAPVTRWRCSACSASG